MSTPEAFIEVDHNVKTTQTITHIGIHLGPDINANDAVVGVRVVPDGKNSNEVYGRTLNFGEPDSGESIKLEVGEKLVFLPGSVNVTLQDVDRYADPEPDGYATIANTVWTWLQIPPLRNEAFFNYLLAASRRLDTAHALCVSVLREIDNYSSNEPFIKTRARVFKALGHAELMCIALNRAIMMIKDAHDKVSATTTVPNEIGTIQEAVLAIRNAFEHIDERAMGNARKEDSADAMSIFNQADLISGILRYANHSLDLKAEVIPALIVARKFIFDVVAEAGTTKTINFPIEFELSGSDFTTTNSAG